MTDVTTETENPEDFAFTAENMDAAKAVIAKYPDGWQASAVMPLSNRPANRPSATVMIDISGTSSSHRDASKYRSVAGCKPSVRGTSTSARVSTAKGRLSEIKTSMT